MVRLEFKEGSSNKFWELALEGAEYKVKWGRIGSDGQEKQFTFPSSTKAKTEADKLIAEKKKKGYQEVASADGEKAKKPKKAKVIPTFRNAALEKTIAKSPDDADGYLVYADWLAAQGDPRGELITIQHQVSKLDLAGRKTEKGKALIKREKEILRKNDDFLGDVKPSLAHPTWRWGFIDSVKFTNKDDWMEDGVDVAGIVKKTFALPACAFLNHLRIAVMRWDYVGKDVPMIVKLAGQAPFAKTIRQITVGDLKGEEVDTGMYEPGKMDFTPFSNLEILKVHGADVWFTPLVSQPKLRELHVETCGLPKKMLAVVMGSKLSKLEKLCIWFGSEDYGANCKIKDLQPIFDGTAIPKVKYLGLMNCEFTDAIVKELPKSKILKRLEHLDLSLGTLYTAGVKTILENKKAFAHLKSINVNDNFLTKKDLVELKKIGPEIISKEQKDVDDSIEGEIYRYVSVSE